MFRGLGRGELILVRVFWSTKVLLQTTKNAINSNREAKSRPGRLHGGAAGTCDNDAVLSTMRQEKIIHPKQQKNKCNLWRLHLITLL